MAVVRFVTFCSLLVLAAVAHAELVIVRSLPPGSADEQAALFKNFGSAVASGERRVYGRGGWIYRIVVPPGSRCLLSFQSQQRPAVSVTGFNGKPLQSRQETGGQAQTVHTTAPAAHPLGGALRFLFHSEAVFAVRDVKLTVHLSDSNGDGVADATERMMGLGPNDRATAIPRPTRPHTSFQTGGPYLPEIGLPTDAVLSYGADPLAIRSWAESGRTVQTMGGFRDGPKYAAEHPDEVQRDVNGQPIEIGGTSFYIVPTPARIEIAKQYFRTALSAGSTAVCPEEPEYWSRGGYEEAFKKEWLARYGTTWRAPHSGIDARYRAEQLKGLLETRLIDSVLNEARRLKPSATRMVAVHSPVTYYDWGFPCPHYALIKLAALDEMIGQVWTGTARTPARSAGVRTERTFEVGYLEYSSLYHIARGTGKRMWFLMDPVEDKPALSMTDYRENYRRTLLASLMFPGIDSYEVMPWPGRVYGRVPADYATEINTIVGALADMWQYSDGKIEAGSAGIGTFVSDSMGWQREQPYPSDYDGFYGLSLPLVLHGVPVDVLSLDRAAEPGYLDREKVLLLSYDFLKPSDPALNKALADWTRRGGSLVIFGGTDRYNDVSDSWWKKAGLGSPMDDLFAQLGIPAQITTVAGNGVMRKWGYERASGGQEYTTLVKADATDPAKRNRGQYVLDVTPFTRQTGSLRLRFEDATPGDGSGPAVYSAELRIAGRLAASFRTGSEIETRFLEEDGGSRFDGRARFADRSGYWVYRFDNLPQDAEISISLDMANGYLVRAASATDRGPVIRAVNATFDRTLSNLRLRPGYPLSLYAPPPSARALYTVDGESAPIVWEAPVGSGNVLFAGIAPGYLTASAQSSRWMRALAGYAYKKSGGQYQESASFKVERGPYVGVRALGKEASLDGRYVDLLNPSLPLVEDPVVPARGLGFFAKVSRQRGAPKALAVSGRVRAKTEQSGTTGFLVQAPAGTNGAARIWCGKRRISGVKVVSVFGEPIKASAEMGSNNVLIRYPNHPDGVIVHIGWK